MAASKVTAKRLKWNEAGTVTLAAPDTGTCEPK